ncbi:hypothetical protein, conserved [Leishmania tarentolae]|uniref:Cyclic nucleotide-binding domain-containing protein n=1 Tax=Leishmania tarentolae TaxID=5689 RepID=A0A640KPG4_LEITA|nr:hypothetical protein, conserved [Leishmania tarentolae]
MSVSLLLPKLPSGQQIKEGQLPTAVQEHLRAVALQVLQRLFLPIWRRHRLRKARLALNQKILLSHASPEEVEAAAFSALQHTSYLGAVTRDLYTLADGGRSVVRGAATEAQSAAMAIPQVDAATGAEIHEKVRDILHSSYVQVIVHLQEEILEWEWEPASEVLVLVGGTLERHGTAVAMRKMTASTVGGHSVGASVLPGGSQRASAVVGHGFSRRGSIFSSDGGRLEATRRGSAVMLLSTSSCGGAAASSAALPPTSAISCRLPNNSGQDRAASISGMDVSAGAPAMSNSSLLQTHPFVPAPAEAGTEFLTAPQVLGELACVGGFPYCAALSVSSPMAIILRIPKVVYCHMVTECATSVGQQRLLVEALQMRERLLPYFAPLTRARLRICPLLARLRTEQLEHIRDLVIPRVYAAGMDCGEEVQPTHIFFIRRGVVQMRREETVSGNNDDAQISNSGSASPQKGTLMAAPHTNLSLELPRNRSLLVEGHTYGEMSCIFGDIVGVRHRAVTHVDMYLLPFQVLIQLMKQEPEVHSLIYHSAQELSYMCNKEWTGALFGPRLVGAILPGVHGVVPADGMLALMAAGAHERARGSGSSAYRGQGPAEVSVSSFHPPTDSVSRSGGGGHQNPAMTRRVTIFEEASKSVGTGDSAGGSARRTSALPLTGGRVSSALLSAMEHLPLVSLLPGITSDFYHACIQQWQCVRYNKGDTIVTSGEECNRLLLFFEGRAGIVMNAAQLREVRSGALDSSDISSASLVAVCPIPSGHIVGYTCVRRHRWTRSIVALDDVVEVWELRRNTFVQLLRTHGVVQEMQVATLQVLQPLVAKERLKVLDYQPLLHPMPSSLWKEQAVPNVHPVVATNENTVLFPVWREGDFPLDRRQTAIEATARVGSPRSR